MGPVVFACQFFVTTQLGLEMVQKWLERRTFYFAAPSKAIARNFGQLFTLRRIS